MKTIWVNADEGGKVTAAVEKERYAIGMQAVEVDDGFELSTIDDYRLQDWKLVCTGEGTAAREEAEEQAKAEAERRQAVDEGCQSFFIDGGKSQMEQDIKDAAASGGADPQILAFARMAVVPMAASLTDEQALSVSSLWPDWSADSVSYAVDSVVRYNDHLWRCEQAHTSQASWTPDAAPSLWSQIDIADDGIDVWTQPTGVHNAYNKGDRVHYPGKDGAIYESMIDGNSWSPDAYPQGWKLVEDAGETAEPEEPGGETYPAWTQPTGAHDAYSKGDRVTYGGKVYESLIDSNVWSPDAYPAGWQLVE